MILLLNTKCFILFYDLQTAQTLTKAFEQFVKPEQLDGDNAYKCSKCVFAC